MSPRLLTVACSVLAGVLVLGACAGSAGPTPERSVVHAEAGLPAAEVDPLTLPYPFKELPTFDLPFDDVPESMDGVLLGLRELDGVLEFSAVSTRGDLLWSTQRPASCSGFTLTRAGGTPIAVLTDVQSTDDALAQVTASAYDLHTGEQVWGPVPVAGPWHGPGTVFAAPAPASAMGQVGDVQLLDPTTGAVVDTSGDVVGEFSGTVLTVAGTGDDATLHASGAYSWQTPVSALTARAAGNEPEVAALPGREAPEGYALLSVDMRPEGAVLRIADGRVITTGADGALWDAAAEMLVVSSPGTLAGFGPEGPRWSRDLDEELRLSATGGVLTYLRSSTSVQVINAMTGEVAVGYDTEAASFAVPQLITSDGAAVFDLGHLVLAGTHPGP